MSSTTPPRVPRPRGARARYGIRFSPYLWVKQLDMATPILHTVTEVIADVVDPDGGHCWLTYDTIAERACHLGRSSVDRAIKTLVAYKVVRKVEGQERLDILDRAGARYTRNQPPTVLELLIPASAYSSEDLERVNKMRAALGRPAITSRTRPDITGMIGEPKKQRSDKGKEAPQRRRKDVRAAEAEAAEQQPSLYSYQEAEGPPEDPYDETPPMSQRHGDPCLSDIGAYVSETHNPYPFDPMDLHPSAPPSVDGSPQGGEIAGQSADGEEGGNSTRTDTGKARSDAGEGASRSPNAGQEDEPVTTLADSVVDQLLERTEALGATPLTDPVQDRAHLVGLAQRALDRGMTASQLWSIVSVGLHNVKRQWALVARLADPVAFSRIKQVDFGSSVPSVCALHPDAVPNGQGLCATCEEIEYQAALARGEIQEATLGEDGVWRDHKGTALSEVDDFEGLSEAEIGEQLAEREQMRQALRGDARKGAASARAALALSRLTEPEPTEADGGATPGAHGASGGI